MSDGNPPSPAATPDDAKKEYSLWMVVEIVDTYIRSSAGISTEVGLKEAFRSRRSWSIAFDPPLRI